MMNLGGSRFVLAGDAEQTIGEIAKPQLEVVAQAIAGAIPGRVPVVDGTMRASYQPTIEASGETVRVHVGSPFWHWMEYGTAYNSPTRPVENAVTGLGIRWEAQ